jgi:pimeloyl-ACP methyl ester carboxylesterase
VSFYLKNQLSRPGDDAESPVELQKNWLRCSMLPLLFSVACIPPIPADTASSAEDSGVADSADTSSDTAADSSGDSGQDSGDTGVFDPPDDCPATEAGRQDVNSPTAGPYLVGHPVPDVLWGPTVVFLPGGNGKGPTGSASSGWNAFFGDDVSGLGYRIVVPYVTEDGYPNSVVPNVEAILDEVLACWGGDPAKVHLVGHSNGGYLAYNVSGPDLADRWVTITGAPAYFDRFEKNKLEGIAFHNAAGENDPTWLEAMTEAHDDLTENGFDSTLTVWANTGHTPDADWDGLAGMIAFWDAHPTR